MKKPYINTNYFAWTLIMVILLISCTQKPSEQTGKNVDNNSPPSAKAMTLNFGVYTSDKPTEMVEKFRPVLNALESKLNQLLQKPVRILMQVANTYERGIENIVAGKVDFSRVGPASYIMIKQKNPDVTILAMENNKGQKVFNGLICVHQESLIHDVHNLKGKRFAFGNERSTIGRYLSQLYLLKHNIKASDFSHYEYLRRHDKVGTAVGLRRFDAGALKEGTFKKLVGKGVAIRKIATFPNVTKPWVARSDLPETIQQALRQSLLELDDPAALKALGKDGFLDGRDEDYNIIREAILKNPAFFSKSK